MPFKYVVTLLLMIFVGNAFAEPSRAILDMANHVKRELQVTASSADRIKIALTFRISLDAYATTLAPKVAQNQKAYYEDKTIDRSAYFDRVMELKAYYDAISLETALNAIPLTGGAKFQTMSCQQVKESLRSYIATSKELPNEVALATVAMEIGCLVYPDKK